MTADRTLVNVPSPGTYCRMASQVVNDGCCIKSHCFLKASASRTSFSVRTERRSNFFWLRLRYQFQNICISPARRNSS